MGKKEETLADRLKRLRAAAKLTQQELAVSAGLSLGNVVTIEAGKTTDPRISTVLALARALGVGLEELVEGRKPR
jgi:putative transcriptional regulator